MSHAVARIVRPLPSRDIWTFAGLVVLACFVWLAGPLFAFAEFRPFESGAVRAATIVALFVAWGARIAWRGWRAGQLNAQLLNQLREAAPRPAATGDPRRRSSTSCAAASTKPRRC